MNSKKDNLLEKFYFYCGIVGIAVTLGITIWWAVRYFLIFF